MTLEEATLEDLFREIRGRYPEGALLAVLKPDRSGPDFEPEFECHSWNTFACIGLARVAERIMTDMESRNAEDKEIEEDP